MFSLSLSSPVGLGGGTRVAQDLRPVAGEIVNDGPVARNRGATRLTRWKSGTDLSRQIGRHCIKIFIYNNLNELRKLSSQPRFAQGARPSDPPATSAFRVAL